jgi:hypothetical protein
LALAAVLALGTLGTSAFSTGLKGDLDNDGDVDAKDPAAFSQNYGKVAGECFDRESCITGYYCAKDIGDCNGAGVCTQKPSVCLEIYDPVCGCEGETYANPCFAAAAGVSVVQEGECPPPGHFKLDEIFTFRYQEKKRHVKENIRIKFERVRHDGRCPIVVHCVWPGNAEVEFIFSKNNMGRTIRLNTTVEPAEVFLLRYRIKLVRLEQPVRSYKPPEQEDYIAYLIITGSPLSCYDDTEWGTTPTVPRSPGIVTAAVKAGSGPQPVRTSGIRSAGVTVAPIFEQNDQIARRISCVGLYNRKKTWADQQDQLKYRC